MTSVGLPSAWIWKGNLPISTAEDGDQIKVFSALHRSNPEDVVTGFFFKESFCSPQGFCHGYFGLFFGDFPACGNVKDGGDVAADAFLVGNNFFLG